MRLSALALFGAAAFLAAAAPPDSANEPWDVTSARSSAQKAADGTRIFSFEEDVVITHGGLVATTDAARYLEAVSRTLLSGNVVMTQDSLTARGPSAIYERLTRIARFSEGVVLEGTSGTAVADQGVWHRDEKLFELMGRASAADTSATIDASSMQYDVARDVFRAQGNARLVDEASGVIVHGGLLEYDRRAGLAHASASPSAEFSDVNDDSPVKVFSELMTYDPRPDVAVARRGVHILRETSEAFADSATFLRDAERVVLGGSPRLVDGLTEVTGDAMELIDEAPGRRRVLVTGSARVAHRFLSDRDRPAAGDSSEVLESEPGDAQAPLPHAGDAGFGAAAPPAEEPLDGSAAPPGSEGPASPPDSAAAPPDPRPAWLKIPSDRLPTENLLFGDRMELLFEGNELSRVEVDGNARSKFYPSEEEGELEEWNDVAGDTLHVWFTSSDVDSVVVLGSGVGEYRMGPEEGGATTVGIPAEELLKTGRLVRYRAPRIRYVRAAETMHLDRGAEVEYKTMLLKSGVIDFDARKEIMDASGDPAPVLVDRADRITGTDMRYHLGSEKGEIVRGRTKFENGWYSGSDVWRLPDNVLAVETASFTTCDLETPHFHFSSKRMKIYPNDKIVAKPVVLKIRNIPVLALPYYFASLRKERHSGFLFPNLELGVDDSRGRFIRKVGYYWVPNDYTDLTTSFDFYPEQERFVGYLTARYSLRYRYDGRFEVKYNRDVPQNRKDTVYEIDHRQTISETSELTASGRFLSASSIYRDIDDEQRLDRDIRSHATFTKRFPGSNQSLRMEVERRENLDTGVVNETLPIVQYSLPSRPLGGRKTGAYYSLDARGVHVRDVSTAGVEVEHVGSRVGLDVRGTQSLRQYLRVTPSVTSEAVWMDVDRFGDRNATRTTFTTNVGAASTVYGTFLRPIGPALGFRHVFEPQVSWSWAPEFDGYFAADSAGVRRDRFFSFGGIGGTPGKTNRGTLSIRNLLQTKLLRGGQERRYDFMTLRHSISYDFLAEEAGRKPLSSISSSLNLLSSSPVNQTWTVVHDPYGGGVITTAVTTQLRASSAMFRGAEDAGGADAAGIPPDPSFTTPDPAFAADPGDPTAAFDAAAARGLGTPGTWDLDLSHSFQRGSGGGAGSSSRLVLGTSWVPTRKWRVSFNSQYDLKTGENTTQQWSVHRTIHCWELSFDRRFLGGEWQYYLRINVTDLPDIQAQRGDRSTGQDTFGGLQRLGGF